EWTDDDGFEVLDTTNGPLHQRRLYFDDRSWEGHYTEVSNAFLWPVMHLVRERLPEVTAYFPAPQAPTDAAWASYQQVNSAFAEAAMAAQPPGQACWVHDYQLALVPGLLRGRGYAGRVGFFLHTPFPDLQVAAPYLAGDARQRFRQWVGGILAADLAGFQTEHDTRRFRAAVVALGLATERDGALWDGERPIETGTFPVSIDTGEMETAAKTAEMPARFAEGRDANLPLVVGLERSDYTKGIPERLGAVAAAYRAGAHFAYIGVAAPTRGGVGAYARLDEVIASAAADAAEAAEAMEAPFVQLHEAIPWDQVVALQRDADVVFTSSLADGMNLVPLQAAIAQSVRPRDERGVVIAGRDAGVASVYGGFEQDGLAIVDPLNAPSMEDTLRGALEGRPGRISDRFIDAIKAHNAHVWATGFLSRLEGAC
ncbi:MAG TPA: trehalose-6-phosphate synthase, partial [Tepidiformaceae bacterium]|nr:trehalose-6-phosphate synthase [Tepidiformaceae bacterium]